MSKDRDITSLMLRFREVVRHTWNTCFQDGDDLMGPDIQEAFTLVEQGLLQGIVLCACDRTDVNIRYGKSPLPFVRVAPRPEYSELTLQIGLRSGTSTAWEVPTRFEIDRRARFEFVRFFDWNSYEQISLSLVEFHIARMDSRRDLVGSRALVEAHDVRFLLVP